MQPENNMQDFKLIEENGNITKYTDSTIEEACLKAFNKINSQNLDKHKTD